MQIKLKNYYMYEAICIAALLFLSNAIWLIKANLIFNINIDLKITFSCSLQILNSNFLFICKLINLALKTKRTKKGKATVGLNFIALKKSHSLSNSHFKKNSRNLFEADYEKQRDNLMLVHNQKQIKLVLWVSESTNQYRKCFFLL